MNLSTISRRRRNPVLDIRNECDTPKRVIAYHFPLFPKHRRVLYRIEGCSSVFVDRIVGVYLREGYIKSYSSKGVCNMIKPN